MCGTDACTIITYMIKQEPSSASSEILPEQISQKESTCFPHTCHHWIPGLSVYVYKHSALDKNVQMITQKFLFLQSLLDGL